jgi:type II secretory pathway predicted ATPase ExeA
MYDGCFGLTRRPFASVPQVDQYFPATAIEAARTTLARCIQRGEGAGFVVAPSGTGKTLLCLLLAEQFRRSFQVAMLASGRLSTRRALFQAILYALGRPYRYMDEGELRLAVVEHLTNIEGSPKGMLLLIDEAHTLPLRLLEEIRLLSNLARNGQPLVRLVLAGAAALEERFANPKLDSFSQRLSARCYLEAFNQTETRDYIQWQVDSAGGLGNEVYSEATCQTVFQATGGVPRLVNQVCDHALLLAYVAGRKTIEPANVEEAWADLQQLPTPWSGGAKSDAANSGVIEFGSLDDSPEAPAAAGASTTSARVFRVASVEEDEAERGDLEPSEQIHHIEELLAKADDDFQPAGSIGPEIELHLQPTPHPFQEEFEHEEVVSDRYAAKAAQPVQDSVRLLDRGSSSPLSEGRSETPRGTGAQRESGGESRRSITPAITERSATANIPPLMEETLDDTSSLSDQPVQEEAPPTAASIAPTQRHEYRHLFAQLLRG